MTNQADRTVRVFVMCTSFEEQDLHTNEPRIAAYVDPPHLFLLQDQEVEWEVVPPEGDCCGAAPFPIIVVTHKDTGSTGKCLPWPYRVGGHSGGRNNPARSGAMRGRDCRGHYEYSVRVICPGGTIVIDPDMDVE